MKIQFKINYKTQIGQELKIIGSINQLGNDNIDKAVKLIPVDGENGDWELTIEISDNKIENFTYKYFLYDTVNDIRFFEWGEYRKIEISDLSAKNITVYDFWKSSVDNENTFETSAFSNILFKRSTKETCEKSDKISKANLFFNIDNYRINPNHSIAVIGNIPELGEWNTKKYVILCDCCFPQWSVALNVKNLKNTIKYKYCIVDNITKEIITQETEERIIEYNTEFKNDTIIVNDIKFKFDKEWKAAGVAIPVFSLRSKNGHGVGEFLDIKLLVDWAIKVGLKMVQILPVNDTVSTHTWIDSYPYSAISVFALHPIYLNLKAIGNLSSVVTQEIIDEQKNLLNLNEKIDYEAVMKVKSRFYKMIYDEQKNNFLKDPDFINFFMANKYWLVPYAVFSYLRDLFGTADFSKWGRFSKPNKKILDEISNPKAQQYDDIAVHYFIQYHLDKQLKDAAEYAREKGIILKGDIPIGISKNSVDAWLEPNLYNMSVQAGAPPDDFSDEGQNWKFPTYNWSEMEKDNYSWWQMRMKKMADYFDAFRIDHILGFFRIWEIPSEQVQGIMGYFNPSIPVYKNEFSEKGLHFDFFRYCTPFIRDYMLDPIFGNLKDYVKNTFLIEYEPYKFYIHEKFNTQRKIEEFLNISESDTQEDRQTKVRIRNGMFRLLAEVLFLKYPFTDQETFIPRHSLYKTYSFAALNDFEKHKIIELYDDYYFRRNEEFWREKGLEKLQVIKNATNMLICGEDLGMIPKCVPQVMKDLGILSLEVQRMPKDSNIEFTHPNFFPYLSVATPSSHDTSTLRGWWEEDTSRSQRFFNQILGKQGNSPFYCEPWVVQDIIVQHVYCPSMFVVFPIQDILGIDEKLRFINPKEERINNPANPRHYWRYRMHIDLEDLVNETEFNEKFSNLLVESGRFFNY